MGQGAVHRRRKALLIGTAVVLIAVCAAACGSSARLTGTNAGGAPAPDFHLRDSSGQAYSLDQFRGKVVVLTFLYTHCKDYCPLTAELLRHADQAAGHPSTVVYLAVSVDPIGDTPASVTAFDRAHSLGELGNRWHYLIGSEPVLAGVWHSYYINAPTEPGESANDHTSAIYFIDKKGKRVLETGPDISAEALARDELILARR